MKVQPKATSAFFETQRELRRCGWKLRTLRNVTAGYLWLPPVGFNLIQFMVGKTLDTCGADARHPHVKNEALVHALVIVSVVKVPASDTEWSEWRSRFARYDRWRVEWIDNGKAERGPDGPCAVLSAKSRVWVMPPQEE